MLEAYGPAGKLTCQPVTKIQSDRLEAYLPVERDLPGRGAGRKVNGCRGMYCGNGMMCRCRKGVRQPQLDGSSSSDLEQPWLQSAAQFVPGREKWCMSTRITQG